MKIISVFYGMLFILVTSGFANAALTTIGTATYDDGYGAANYKLIWDDDNNGNSVVWLDYTNDIYNGAGRLSNQKDWAASLNDDGVLTYNIESAYAVNWENNSWRLPRTVDGMFLEGHNGETTGGYNITTSEMGHLYYEELGNLGYVAIDGTEPQNGWGLNKTGDFENLRENWYWSGTLNTVDDSNSQAWFFSMYDGYQGITFQALQNKAMPIIDAPVSVVPVPGAIWLLGSGLIGLLGFKRRKKIK